MNQGGTDPLLDDIGPCRVNLGYRNRFGNSNQGRSRYAVIRIPLPDL